MRSFANRAIVWLFKILRAPVEREEEGGSGGFWPSSRQAFLWDLGPKSAAPGRDGLIPPAGPDVRWVDNLSGDAIEELLVAAKTAHDRALATAGATEAKASRLLTPTIALVVSSVALAGLVLQKAATQESMWYVILSVPASLAAIVFLISAVRSADADLRVGMYGSADSLSVLGIASEGRITVDGVPVVLPDGEAMKRAYLKSLLAARELANWTQRHKASAVMQARAWLSRGLVLFFCALVVTGVVVALPARLAPGSAPGRTTVEPAKVGPAGSVLTPPPAVSVAPTSPVVGPPPAPAPTSIPGTGSSTP
ncbi:hypothetical protein SAMN05216377_11542 [Pseudonocardia oroxyli]|uniref:Uncharacterized protein n=1 Tax=Pseudonocardia oroxyli TaxID=366584 RepID=A0A1G7X092_PSEOR|nr:hypothetical protein SAMN05216377_11542 [Pseudonocardia oroxyli]